MAVARTERIALPEVQSAEEAVGGVSRREFLNYAWLASLGLFFAQLSGVTYLFARPRFRTGQFGGEFALGQVNAYALDAAPQLHSDGKFYVVRTNAGVLALYQVCPHLGCLVPWAEQLNRFACPCHGSQYERDGTYISGPAPRGLDRFVVKLLDAQGNVVATTPPTGHPVVGPDDATLRVDTNTAKRILGRPKGQRY